MKQVLLTVLTMMMLSSSAFALDCSTLKKEELGQFNRQELFSLEEYCRDQSRVLLRDAEIVSEKMNQVRNDRSEKRKLMMEWQSLILSSGQALSAHSLIMDQLYPTQK